MSQTRWWPLSKDASVAFVTQHFSCITVTVPSINMVQKRIHVPVQPSLSSSLQPVSQTASVSQSVATNSASITQSPAIASDNAIAFSPIDCGLTKHIPKSARVACTNHLASLLRSATAHPETSANWETLFNWRSATLHPPKRCGKKHNLTTCIKKRISDYSLAACYQPML